MILNRELPLNYDPNTRPLFYDNNNNNNKWSKRAVKSRAEKMKRLYSSQLVCICKLVI